MKRHFGLRPPEIEPAELSAGALYAIFAIVVVVLWVTFTYPN